MPTITSVNVIDIRFPTSATLDGSDAMNPDGDYSAAYVVLETDDGDLAGYGLTFTIGRGNDLCVAAARQIGARLAGRDVDELAGDLGGLYREIMADSQMRWLGPEKGVVHLSAAGVLNAAWDLAARRAGKPLWRFVADMTPEELVAACDFRYLSDVLTPAEAVGMLARLAPTREERIAELAEHGYPAYTTSPGWLGYDDGKLRRLCREAVADGWTHVKLKVGANVEDDVRRLSIAREELGDRVLMIDANQVWDVPQAIEWVNRLAPYEPLWIEEPTSPDDVLGHAAIRKAIAPVGVATGEHCHNRVMFKQLLQAGAIDFCQIDSCRLASVNEIVPVLLMAAKFGVPVCPHAGGVGLCELVQHMAVVDYVCVSGSLEGRVLEYVDHLHEHFTDPVRIERGRYLLPGKPGYSARMHSESVDAYRYPDGHQWGG
ncbi:L-fuconate dehydratase [Microbispora catharanthi]|uniref:L-fuconate dehydratase n=1 Tax=Microbispora catharanthi TaxID=1712871 RepID=A0A5N6AWF5_9ACTN|nr:L-fuconate dehydratase [Microbispora catharanthi]KAB8172904.1 fuconate dehydratase [Microbispora catharanthi]